MKSLQRGEVLRVVDGQGSELLVLTGCIWITQDGDASDYVVAAGRSFRIERSGLTLVSGLRAGTIDLRQAVIAPSSQFAAAL